VLILRALLILLSLCHPTGSLAQSDRCAELLSQLSLEDPQFIEKLPGVFRRLLETQTDLLLPQDFHHMLATGNPLRIAPDHNSTKRTFLRQGLQRIEQALIKRFGDVANMPDSLHQALMESIQAEYQKREHASLKQEYARQLTFSLKAEHQQSLKVGAPHGAADQKGIILSSGGRSFISRGLVERECELVEVDALTGKILRTLASGDSRIDKFQISPDGQWLAISRKNQQLEIWDFQRGLLDWPSILKDAQMVELHFTKDQGLLRAYAIPHRDRSTSQILSWGPGQKTLRVSPSIPYTCSAWGGWVPGSPEVWIRDNQKIYLWNSQTGRSVDYQLSPPVSTPLSDLFLGPVSADHSHLVTYVDNSIQVRRIDRENRTIEAIPLTIVPLEANYLVTFATVAPVIAAISDTRGLLRVWNLTNRATLLSIDFKNPGISSPTSVAISGDGRVVAVGFASGKLSLWDLNEAQQDSAVPAFSKAKAHSGAISKMTFSSDDRILFTEDDEGGVEVWTIEKPFPNGA
jgi:WD40 repeat protein